MIRYALIRTNQNISDYLPINYSVLYRGLDADHKDIVTVIAGTDNAGWTLDDYVLPRLASGLYFGQDIDLSHPIMKVIPA